MSVTWVLIIFGLTLLACVGIIWFALVSESLRENENWEEK